MSKPRTPSEQFQKTKNLLGELRSRSGKNWKELYAWIESSLPGLVSGESNMRQLGSGHRFLSDDELSRVAKQALLNGYGGEQAKAAVAYIPPSEAEIKRAERERRHERYLMEDPVERIMVGPMRMAGEEKRRRASALNEALSRMSPAGYSHAEILYMVHSWLVKNPPSIERGKRQGRIVFVQDDHENSLRRAIFPESLPSNFALPEHLDGMPHFIECHVRPMWENWNGTPPDGAADDFRSPDDEENPAT